MSDETSGTGRDASDDGAWPEQDTQPRHPRPPRTVDEMTIENIEDGIVSDVAQPEVDHQTVEAALTSRWQGWLRGGGIALLAVTCVVVASALGFGDFRDTLLRFVHDDAFYYFGIADHMMAGDGSTFDGITSTNGYHPLWQWLLVPPSAVMGNPAAVARLAAIAGVAMLALTAWLLYRVLKRERYATASFPLWWIAAALVPATIYGLESPLAALAFALLVWFEATDEDTRRTAGARRGIVAGVLASLLFLSRIDALVWVAALDLVALVAAAGGKRRPAFVYGLFGAQVVLIGGYFLMNSLLWGHLLTVSALVKSGRAGWFPLTFPWSLLCLLAFALTPISLWALSRRPLLVWIGLGNLIYLGLIVARGGRETFNWYFTIPVVSGAILIPCFIEEAPVIPRRFAAYAAFAFTLIVLAVGVRGKVAKESKFTESYDLAMALSRLKPGAWTIAMTDCGIVGALGHQRVINLDGLTSSFEMQQALRRRQLGEWLTKVGLNGHVMPRTAAPTTAVSISSRPGILGARDKADLIVAPGVEMGRWQMMRVTTIETDNPSSPRRARTAPRTRNLR